MDIWYFTGNPVLFYNNERPSMSGSLPHGIIDVTNVQLVEIFVRVSPPCHFCIEAKNLIQKNFPNTKIVEYDLDNVSEWKRLVSRYPGAKIPPQVMLTRNNGARWLLGGLAELREAFPGHP